MDPFNLNWRHIAALPIIVERRSLSAAAEVIHLSQPALTKGLGKLEQALGGPLFTRKADGLEPTAAGDQMVERARAASALLAAAFDEINCRRGYRGAGHLVTRTHLRAALAIADAGSFTGARMATGLSEPALHRAVRELEAIINVPLAERRGRSTHITPAGRRLAKGIRLAAREVAAGIAEVTEDETRLGPTIIGAMPLARARILPLAIAALQRVGPTAEVMIVEGAWRELVEPLREGSIDLMIGALRNEVPKDLIQTPLFNDQLVVVARVGHPLQAYGDCVSVNDLAGHPWVVGAPCTPLRQQWETLFAGGPPPPAPIACGSTVAIRTILANTDHLTLLSPDQIEVEVAAGMLTTIGPPIAGTVRQIGITTRTGWRPTANQRTLLNLIHGHVDSRVPEKR